MTDNTPMTAPIEPCVAVSGGRITVAGGGNGIDILGVGPPNRVLLGNLVSALLNSHEREKEG